MPRYFFDLLVEDGQVPDPDGRSLADADAAWEAARHLAVDLMRTDLGRPVNWLACSAVVRDEAGETVLEFPFSEAVEARGPPN